jgi:rhodanese-related sulfurtransferase
MGKYTKMNDYFQNSADIQNHVLPFRNECILPTVKAYEKSPPSVFCAVAVVSLGSVAAASVEKQTPPADTITVQDLQSRIRSGATIQLVDVRLPKDRKVDPRLLPTAVWRDPEQVDTWAKALSKNKPVVVYCVHGHRVSQQVESRLSQLGYSVQRLAGGIEAWKAAGGDTVPINK